MRCAHYLDRNGAAPIKDVVVATRVVRAANIFRSDVYGWFDKVERATYADVVATVAAASRHNSSGNSPCNPIGWTTAAIGL